MPETNSWRALPSMRESRGRFQIAVINDKVYAIGGSNGTTELDSVEVLDFDVGKCQDFSFFWLVLKQIYTIVKL